MANLVVKHGDEFATTSSIIASNTGNEHASVIKLVRTYQSDLEEFGRVGFEIEPFETAGGMQQREISVLNEQQATLLLTYMRNSDVVRKFKKALVKEFYRLRNDSQPKARDLPPAKVNDHMIAFKTTFQVLSKIKGIDQNLLATQGLKLAQAGTGIPLHDYLRLALPAPDPTNVPELNATAIGKRYNLGPRKMNEQLEQFGLIERNEKNKPVLTQEGAKYGAMVPYTEHGHSGYQPLFFRTVFDLLDGLMGVGA